MSRLAHVVLDRILAELPEESELARVTRHTLDGLAYKAPEISWMYTSERMAPALFEASELSPRPEWFGRVEAIWFGTEEPDPDVEDRQGDLERAHDKAEAVLGADR